MIKDSIFGGAQSAPLNQNNLMHSITISLRLIKGVMPVYPATHYERLCPVR